MTIAGFLIGAAYGAWIAHKRGGKRLDMLQYAGGFGILFAIAALFLNLLVLRIV